MTTESLTPVVHPRARVAPPTRSARSHPARGHGDQAVQTGDVVVHEYDGIQECDNELPNWWLYSFLGTVIFALGFWFHSQVLKTSLSTHDQYRREMAADYAREAARVRASGLVTPAALLALSRDEPTVQHGRAVFTQTCVPCHGPNAGGNIGPNLTDEYWLHGGRPDQIYHTVSEGVPTRGMPAWGPQLGAERVQAVAAFLLTLRNSHASGGKAPQGSREL